ncbi:MAG: DUF2061 domain-containing protein [Nitrospirota bacterium]
MNEIATGRQGAGMETHIRSVLKGISWRVVGTLDTMLLTFIFSGSIKVAAFVGSTEAVTKIFLYWAHERVWQRIRWGRLVPTVSSP